MAIRKATPADFAAIDELLATARLPSLDPASFIAEDFRVIDENGSAYGAVGIERYASDGLLRSLVVAARGRGAGESLVREIEDHGRRSGLGALYLLTTTAERFFGNLGYETISRDEMPDSVRRSSEFSTLCPASAVCMRKSLGDVR